MSAALPEKYAHELPFAVFIQELECYFAELMLGPYIVDRFDYPEFSFLLDGHTDPGPETDAAHFAQSMEALEKRGARVLLLELGGGVIVDQVELGLLHPLKELARGLIYIGRRRFAVTSTQEYCRK